MRPQQQKCVARLLGRGLHPPDRFIRELPGKRDEMDAVSAEARIIGDQKTAHGHAEQDEAEQSGPGRLRAA